MDVFFDGHKLGDYVDRIRDIRRDILPPRKLVTQSVPGRAGEYVYNAQRGPRITEIDVMLIDREFERLRKRTETLAAILDTEKVSPLVIGDEPDRTRMVILDGETKLSEIVHTGETTLVFYQPDPHKYGDTHTQEITRGFTWAEFGKMTWRELSKWQEEQKT